MTRLSGPPEADGRHFDAIIVGSGYGGAVAACRLAGLKKSDGTALRVCLLERGREYLPGDFPEDVCDLWPHVQIDSSVGTVGRRDALFDIRTNHGVSALVGCALGGTSQINAGVVLAPDAPVFQKVDDDTGRPLWPKSLRVHGILDPYFQRVRNMLDATPFPDIPNEPLPKLRALERLHWMLKKHDKQPVEFETPPIAVSFESGTNQHGVPQSKCINCGNCCTGCNHSAKNTLTTNYLAVAHQLGVEMYTQVLVSRVEKSNGSKNSWKVFFEPNHPRSGGEPTCLESSFVILAAGTLGSNEILLRSREFSGLSLSTRLGLGFSCNGDGIAAGYDHLDLIHASQAGNVARVGPCITGMIKYRPAGDDIRKQFIVQEGSIPTPLRWMFQELGSLSFFAKQFTSLFGMSLGRDPAAPSPSCLEHSQIYLTMGHDSDAGKLYLDDNVGRLRIQWKLPGADATYDEQDRLLARSAVHLGGTYLPNPARKLLDTATFEPLKDASEMDKPIVGSQTFTVHPLGGCAMADDAREGVVNDDCQVFEGDQGVKIHDGLYVCDGSVMPTSLGANPLLTIASIAERAMDQLVADQGWRAHSAQEVHLTPASLPTPNRAAVRSDIVDISFRETLEVYLAPSAPCGVKSIRKLKRKAAAAVSSYPKGTSPPLLRIRYKIDHAFQSLLHDPSHRAVIIADPQDDGIVELPAPIGKVRVVAGELELFRVSDTNIFSRIWISAGREIRYLLNKNKNTIEIGSKIDNFRKILAHPRQVLHYLDISGHKREVIYRIDLESVNAKQTETYHLAGFKAVQNRCDVDLLDATTTVFATVRRGDRNGEIVATGTLVVSLPEFFRSKQSRIREFNQDTIQIDQEADGVIGATALISTGTMLIKAIGQPFFASFRKPVYPTQLPPLRNYLPAVTGRTPAPCFHDFARSVNGLPPPKSASLSLPSGADAQLTRYANPDSSLSPILLVHGFGTASTTFTMETQPVPLAKYLWQAGFDVWLLDNRISIASKSAHQPWSLDSIATEEIPVAIQHIHTATQKQVAALGHCVGGLVLLMALLKDHLLCKKLAAVAISQVGTTIVGSTINEFKSPIAAFLESYVGLNVVDAYPNDSPKDTDSLHENQWRGRFIDRLLSAYHVPAEEVCDSAVCHRVSGMYGLAFNHRNVKGHTHANLHRLFGPANMKTFKHLARIFDAGQPVASGGERTYVSNRNLAAGLEVPLCFLHGADNGVFHSDTVTRTMAQLRQVLPPTAPLEGYRIENYGHQDCIIGNRAHHDVFPLLRSFFEQPSDRNLRPAIRGIVPVH